MKIHTNGITRIVVLIGKYAFKIPNIRYSHKHFLEGCIANYKEREYYRTHSVANYEENVAHLACPSHYVSVFGLLQIQSRCEPMDRDLTRSEKKLYRPLCGTDNKKENFGYLNGKIVCIDYP